MTSTIKKTAIPAAGYFYQTMQGVNLLCDWLDSPSRYTRIRFECDVDEIAPQGLDDLVAERSDGRVDLWQIKFTPSPDKHALDWEWLLKRPGKAGGTSRSNLRKWFDAWAEIEPHRLGRIRLVTNRVPDLAMETCLGHACFIDYAQASIDVRAQVEQELGSATDAQSFFQKLEVTHSDKGFASIEAYVTQRLRRHGAPADGVELLKNRSFHWSISRNQPAPDGWITFELLQSTLRVVPPEPLPENFVIPTDYRVPDTAFFDTFLAAIEAAPSRPLVLTGPPGRGKSTFLSKICEHLQQKDIPLVRHHYYLSATDRTLDRHTSFVVEESLLAQIQNFHAQVATPDRTLTAAVAACAEYYQAEGKPFIIILDGLDHVWRNQGKDKRPLDEIFNQLLPAIANLVIVVGTQPVDDSQLPNRLLVDAPRSTWLALPAMSGDAVLHYLRKVVGQGRLHLDCQDEFAEEGLQSAAAELRVRTDGHPLHVIYATEELVRSGRYLSKWSVEQLAGDLSQDVRHYYGSLWQSLSASQKDVLRLISEFSFFWPSSAFTCIASLASLPNPTVVAVEHLLHHSSAGLRPFHESLVVFTQQTDGYLARITELTPYVESWLGTSAPDALRVNWLWWVKAKQGRPDELITGLQRDWVLQRLQEGYPIELFEALLGEAEEHAVQRVRYADAYRLRHLKTRLLNSLSYQLAGPEAARLKACTWALAPNAGVIDEAQASRHETSVEDVAALSLALGMRGDWVSATRCGEDAIQRYRGESRFSNQRQSSEASARLLYLAQAFSTLGLIGKTPEASCQIVSESWPPIARQFLRAQVEKGDLRALVGTASKLPNSESKVMACDAAVRSALLAEADLLAWHELPQLTCGVLIGCLVTLAGKTMEIWAEPFERDWLNRGYEERQESIAGLAHAWFFGAVRLALMTNDEEFCLLEAPAFDKRENVSGYLNHLGELGRMVANRWTARESVTFAFIYEAFNNIPFPDFRNYEIGRGAAEFRRTLHALAIDLHLLNSRLGTSPFIDEDEMQKVMELPWFDATQFRTQYVSNHPKALTSGAAEYFIRNQLVNMDAVVDEETGARMMACLELCEMALRHDLTHLAGDLCRRTWELALGYGQRKDPTLSDVMEAMKYLTSIAPEHTCRLLAAIAPQVHHVLTYTDGKGTRHVLADTDELLARVHRSALVEKCREHVELGDWSYAEHCLEAYVTTGNAESPFLSSVMRTGLHPEAIRVLRRAVGDGCSDAKHLLTEAEQHVGADVGQVFEQRGSNSSIDSKPFLGDVTSYPLDDLSRLLTDLREYYGVRTEVLRTWYRYWEAQGQGSALITTLEPKLLSAQCRDDDLHELLDMAFATKLKLEGASAAFPYIVQEQRMHGGWSGSMMEAQKVTEARLKRVVQTYPRRCDEFFLKSAFSPYSRPSSFRIIPSDMMVYFLVLQGRDVEAISLVEAMVTGLQEDTRTLRLVPPIWAERLLETSEDHSLTDLELLMVRLRWPVASTRWWAMQELAALLSSPDTREPTSNRLLAELTQCRLESEAVEILCLIWMAQQQGFLPPDDLPAAVTYPSLLAVLLLESMQLDLPGSANPPLEFAPDDFVVPERFGKFQNFGVPGIFLNRLAQLEHASGLPFLRQCAYEWHRTEIAYPQAPMQGDLIHFVRPLGDGATGSFVTRALLRMITAYQRTLEFARTAWRAPEKLIQSMVVNSLPIDPTLALLRPQRPSWLPSLGKAVVADIGSTEDFIRQALNNLEAAQPDAVLLSLVSPIYVDSLEIVELTVVRWHQWGNSPIQADDLALRFFDRQRKEHFGACRSPMWGTITEVPTVNFEHVLDRQTNAVPLAAVHGLRRFGYLQRDLYPSRLYYPVSTGLGGKLTVEPMCGSLKISAAHGQVATSQYWNAGWSSAHPGDMSGLCGTALVGTSLHFQFKKGQAPDGCFYLWRLTRRKRSYSYEPFSMDVPIHGVMWPSL
ncbi:MAG: ATP-binding protein [Pseudomonas sp.]|uniref:ATP-binding protein n=1 Tax=Pseudomonas sp. TaxID=306 RepID=UPI002FC5BEC9